MRIGVANWRGLGNGPTVRALLDFKKREDPDVLFLSKTKLSEDRLEWWRWKLEMPNMVGKSCDGHSGWLALFWKNSVNLKAGLKSKYHIDAEITEEDGFVWRFTGIYGEPKSDAKEITWRLLRNIKHHSDKPWLCAGDFNEILLACEKEGGAARPQIYMDRFKEALEDCALHDLGFVGDPFTWRNNSSDSTKYIRERLDRACATQEWCGYFPAYKVIHGDHRNSDHRLLIIEVERESKQKEWKGASGLSPRFEASWLEEEMCDDVVANAWQRSVDGLESTSGALCNVMADLKEWSKFSLGDVEKRIARTKKDLERCRRGLISDANVRKEQILRYKLDRMEH
jgi:hypothetical protein